MLSQNDLLALQQQQAEMIQQIHAKPEIAKAIDTTNQPAGYNLSPLVSVLEPMWERYNIFTKRIPRVTAAGATGKDARWFQIDSVTNGKSSSFEGGLGSETVTKSTLMSVPYKTIAIYDSVTKESMATGQGFLDAKGSSVIRALRKIRQKEEYKIIGGNITALGAVSSFTTQVAAGGSISAGVYSLKVCPLTAECLQSLVLNTNAPALALVQDTDVNNAAVAGKYWGVGLPSASAVTATTTSTNGKIGVTITPLAAAFAYAIFAKVGADAYTLQAITTYSKFTLTNYFTTGAAIGSVDGSGDAQSFDGLLPQILAGGNAFGGDLGYAQFTADETGVVEINTALMGIFDAYKVSATNIYVSGDLRNAITKANIRKGGVNALTSTSDLNNMTAGRIVGNYIHPSIGENISIETHPYLPKGTCLITTEQLDLPELGISNVMEMHVAQDYFQRDVQQPLRKEAFEVYAYEALGMRTPLYNAIIKNVAPGLAA